MHIQNVELEYFVVCPLPPHYCVISVILRRLMVVLLSTSFPTILGDLTSFYPYLMVEEEMGPNDSLRVLNIPNWDTSGMGESYK